MPRPVGHFQDKPVQDHFVAAPALWDGGWKKSRQGVRVCSAKMPFYVYEHNTIGSQKLKTSSTNRTQYELREIVEGHRRHPEHLYVQTDRLLPALTDHAYHGHREPKPPSVAGSHPPSAIRRPKLKSQIAPSRRLLNFIRGMWTPTSDNTG